jgi:hypothetical protein
MNASFRIEQVNFLLSQYREAMNRPAMLDLAIWQTLETYYQSPDDWDIVLTSTREEAFDRMVKDQWTVNMGEHIYGLDYETIDELVLDYLKDNKLVTSTDEEKVYEVQITYVVDATFEIRAKNEDEAREMAEEIGVSRDPEFDHDEDPTECVIEQQRVGYTQRKVS